MDNQTLVSENVAPYSSRFIPHSQSKISTTANSTNKPTDETIIRDYHKKLQTLSFHPEELQHRQYRSYLTKWCTFCCQQQINVFTPTEVDIIELLTMLYKSGVGYSYTNTTRSALSSYLTLGKSVSVGQLPLVKRCLKGVYNKRPIVPRYQQT
jgi:hypothetical protein